MNYNGLLLSAQHRLSQNFTLQTNYTWSHCIGDATDLVIGPRSGDTLNNPGNRWFDRGDCDGDRRFLFNSTGVMQSPHFNNRAVRTIATGWTLSPIFTWSSGQPINVLTGTDTALNGVQGLTGNNFQRGNQVLADAYTPGAGGPLSQWLNPGAFKTPSAGTLGTIRRNSVVGPAYWTFNVALSRQFRLIESQRLEVRAEAFNLTNSFIPALSGPGIAGSAITNFSSLNSNTFGQIRTAQDPRIMQFALKYVF